MGIQRLHCSGNAKSGSLGSTRRCRLARLQCLHVYNMLTNRCTFHNVCVYVYINIRACLHLALNCDNQGGDDDDGFFADLDDNVLSQMDVPSGDEVRLTGRR